MASARDIIMMIFGADTKPAVKEIKKTTEAVQDTEDAVEDVGDTSTKSTKKIEDGFADSADSADDLAGTVGDVAGSFEDFDGTATGAVQSVAGAIGGLAGLIPGIGGFIGGAVAGIVTSMLDATAKAAEESAARTQAAIDDMLESGRNALTDEFFTTKIKEIWEDPQLAANAARWAATIGTNTGTVVAALAGVPTAMDEVTASIARGRAEIEAAGPLDPEDSSAAAVRIRTLAATYDLLETGIRNATDSTSDAAVSVAVLRDAFNTLGSDAAAAAGDVDKVTKAVDGIPATVTVKVYADMSDLDRKLAQTRSIKLGFAPGTVYGQRLE